MSCHHWDDSQASPHPALFPIEMGSGKLFSLGCLGTKIFPVLAFKVIRVLCVSHQCLASGFILEV
jgi:hypothetical protein